MADQDSNNADHGSWVEWRRLVLSQLQDGKRERKSIRDDIAIVKGELTALKIRVYAISTGIALIGSAGISIALNYIGKMI